MSSQSSGNSTAAPSGDLSPPAQALLWLKKGGFKLGAEWEKAHQICQTAEGTFEYDLVHALAHWIEGDIANRDYWYRRVGKGWLRAETIEKEWEQMAEKFGLRQV